MAQDIMICGCPEGTHRPVRNEVYVTQEPRCLLGWPMALRDRSMPPQEESKLPPDWYDGNPKRCLGTGEFPRAMRTGELQDHGQGLEPVYLSRCLWCNKPLPPSERAAEHTFIPVRAEEFTFKTGKYLYGIERDFGDSRVDQDVEVPALCALCSKLRAQARSEGKAGFMLCEACLAARGCDGDHAEPPCAHEQCHLKAPPVYTVSARARQVGDTIELLCGSCELPLSTEASVWVTDEQDPSAARVPWHLSCAKKHAEPPQ